MKNKIIVALLSIILLPGMWSCEKWLEIEPENELVVDAFWKSEADVTAVLAACYRSLSEPGSIFRMLVWGEVRSDNVMEGLGTRGSITKILEVDIAASNEYCHWGSLYNTINYCNTFLYYAPEVVDIDENFSIGELRALEAEVRTIRALCYFYLVRTFREVPLISEPSLEDDQDYAIPKASEREILDFIIEDLVAAKQSARTNFSTLSYTKGRITKKAVNSLLADVYLWDEQYAQCVAECDEVLAEIESGTTNTFDLLDADDFFYQVFYRGNSAESIFELQFDQDEIYNEATSELYGTFGNNQGELVYSAFLAPDIDNGKLFNYRGPGGLESEEDIRAKDFINLTFATIAGQYQIFKYAGIQRTENNSGTSNYFYRSNTSNWIFYRLADVMLMKAEALAELNRSENDLREALNLVNTTYLRANPELGNDSLDFNNFQEVQDLKELVLRERQRELLFEGKRWFDLLRLARRDGTPNSLLEYVSPKFTGDSELQYSKMSIMDALYMPIAQSELDANPALEQNPFYILDNSTEETN